MKKVAFAVLSCFIIAGTVFGQSEMNFGLIGGMNLANFRGDDADDTDIKFGAAGGGFAMWTLNEQVKFRPEIIVTMKGATGRDSDSGQILDGDYDLEASMVTALNYVEVPLLTSWKLQKDFSLLAGPSVGFYMNGRSEYSISGSVGGETIDESESESIGQDEVTTPDIGLIFGLSYQLNSILLEGRYNFGLSDVPDTDQDVDLKHSVFQIQVGYILK